LWSAEILAQGRRPEDVSVDHMVEEAAAGLDKTRRNLVNQLKRLLVRTAKPSSIDGDRDIAAAADVSGSSQLYY